MRRNRSGSASTDTKSQNGSNFSSVGPSTNGDDITSLSSNHASGTSTPRKLLRPSLSAAQLGNSYKQPSIVATSPDTLRSRSGTTPTSSPPLSSSPAHHQMHLHLTPGMVKYWWKNRMKYSSVPPLNVQNSQNHRAVQLYLRPVEASS